MYRIKFLPHTADIRMNVEADTLEEIYKGAFEGMRRLIKKKIFPQDPNKIQMADITIESGDPAALLVDFLNKVLSLSHINKIVYTEIKITNFNNKIISATVKGHPIEKWDEDIKAVTYHEAAIFKSEDQKWVTNLIFDI